MIKSEWCKTATLNFDDFIKFKLMTEKSGFLTQKIRIQVCNTLALALYIFFKSFGMKKQPTIEQISLRIHSVLTIKLC